MDNVWGVPAHPNWDELFEDKFMRVDDGSKREGYRLEMRPDWSFTQWILGRVADIPKTCSPKLASVAA